jgi:hypothetical protein
VSPARDTYTGAGIGLALGWAVCSVAMGPDVATVGVGALALAALLVAIAVELRGPLRNVAVAVLAFAVALPEIWGHAFDAIDGPLK